MADDEAAGGGEDADETVTRTAKRRRQRMRLKQARRDGTAAVRGVYEASAQHASAQPPNAGAGHGGAAVGGVCAHIMAAPQMDMVTPPAMHAAVSGGMVPPPAMHAGVSGSMHAQVNGCLVPQHPGLASHSPTHAATHPQQQINPYAPQTPQQYDARGMMPPPPHAMCYPHPQACYHHQQASAPQACYHHQQASDPQACYHHQPASHLHSQMHPAAPMCGGGACGPYAPPMTCAAPVSAAAHGSVCYGAYPVAGWRPCEQQRQ